jgi:hypothetical protein
MSGEWTHYIERADISDEVVKQFITADEDSLDAYFTETDDYLEDIAETLQVNADDIDVDSGGQVKSYIVKRFCIVFLCMRVCQDKAGKNNVEVSPDMDKYSYKYAIYTKELAELTKSLTPEVLAGDVDEAADRATQQTNYLFRS